MKNKEEKNTINYFREINKKYMSDKGIRHSYSDFYDNTFFPIKDNVMNLLEIGVLFGNSLKLWSDYFSNAIIYGIDDFSQKDGQGFYNYKNVIAEEIKKDLYIYERIKLFIFDCYNVCDISKNLTGIKFDVIIDDADHNINSQIKNYVNYSSYLSENGLYICEDVRSNAHANEFKDMVLKKHPNKLVEIFEFNTNIVKDDRIIFVR